VIVIVMASHRMILTPSAAHVCQSHASSLDGNEKFATK
jgi:hypothetical protein